MYIQERENRKKDKLNQKKKKKKKRGWLRRFSKPDGPWIETEPRFQCASRAGDRYFKCLAFQPIEGQLQFQKQ